MAEAVGIGIARQSDAGVVGPLGIELAQGPLRAPAAALDPAGRLQPPNDVFVLAPPGEQDVRRRKCRPSRL